MTPEQCRAARAWLNWPQDGLAKAASVGVSTSEFVRNEGEVIRHNFGWTIVLLVYLVLIGVACYLFFPNIAALPK